MRSILPTIILAGATLLGGGCHPCGKCVEKDPPQVHLIVPNAPFEAALSSPFEQQIKVDGPPKYFCVGPTGGLPPGILLSDQGDLQGIPTVTGHFPFTIDLYAVNGTTDQATFVIDVPNQNAALLVPGKSAPDGLTVGIAASSPLTVSGGTPPFEFHLTDLPLLPGLTLDSTGIHGTPQMAGSETVTVAVSDGSSPSQISSASVSISATAPGAEPLRIGQTILPLASPGRSYEFDFTVTGAGSATVTCELVPGSWLPPSFSLDPSCKLVGTPDLGIFQFGVMARTSTQQSMALFALVPAGAIYSVDTWWLPVGHIGTPYSATVPAGVIVAGALPDGLSLADGVISGTPVAVGDFVFTLSASNTAQTSARLLHVVIPD